MEVRATKEGYHAHRLRKVGEVFELEPVHGLDAQGKKKTFTVDMQFADFWMEKIEDDENRAKAKVTAKKTEKATKTAREEDVI